MCPLSARLPTQCDEPMTGKWRCHARDGLTLLLAAAVVFAVYLRSSPVILDKSVMDSVWTVPIAMSIIKQGNTDLDEYRNSVTDRQFFGAEIVRTHIQPYFPIGTPVLVVPFVYIISRYAVAVRSFDLYERLKSIGPDGVTYQIELIVASLIVASVVMIIYLIGRRSLNRAQSLLLVAIFAFGTSAWSTASRALWQHGPSMLMLSLTLYLLLRAQDDPRWVQFAGFPLALSYVIRPTNSISILILTVFVFLQYRRYFVRFMCGAALVAVPFVLFNLHTYDALLSPYYAGNRIGTNASLSEALLGTLFSPSRGLYVFSPILILVTFGIALEIRAGEFKKLDLALVSILLLHWFAISSFPVWWGGYSYGPRLFTDVVPYLIYFLIPVVARVTRPRRPGDSLLLGVFICLALASVFTHYRGATQQAVLDWNAGREGVLAEVNATRVWDWRDPQFLRGLRPGRFAVEPQNVSLSVSESDTRDPVFRLTVRNLGDKELSWRAAEPQGIRFQSGTSSEISSLDGLAYRELSFGVDFAPRRPGVHNLGEIRFEVFSAENALEDGKLVSVPVVVNVMPADAARSAPSGIRVER
jgi:hypothetical protein